MKISMKILMCVCLMALPVSTASATIFFLDTFEDRPVNGTLDPSKWGTNPTSMSIRAESGNQYATNGSGNEHGARHFKDGVDKGGNYIPAGDVIHGYALMRINPQSVNTKSYMWGTTQFYRNDDPATGHRWGTANAHFRMYWSYSNTKAVLMGIGRDENADNVNQSSWEVMTSAPSAGPDIGEWIALKSTFNMADDTVSIHYSTAGGSWTSLSGGEANPLVGPGTEVFGLGNIVLYNQNYDNNGLGNEGSDQVDYDNIMISDQSFTPDQLFAIPEPLTLSMLALGGFGVLRRCRR
jgi:hypothetical protein